MPLIDCSQPLETGMPVYPGDDPVAITETSTVPADGSALRRIECSSHVGTHVDAPAHKVAGGPTLDDYAVGDFVFDARLVDCTHAAAREPLQPGVLPEQFLDDQAAAQQAAADVDALVFHTGWSEHWGTDRYRDSPYLAPALARRCAETGYHVGLDAFSPDPVPSAEPSREGADEPTDQPAHAELCGADRLVLESLRGLDRLPERFELRATPLRIREGDGSPVRAVARVPDGAV